jgi:hypothetical protein
LIVYNNKQYDSLNIDKFNEDLNKNMKKEQTHKRGRSKISLDLIKFENNEDETVKNIFTVNLQNEYLKDEICSNEGITFS